MLIEAHRLLIGSLGDDSHSVGMSLLETAFKESGFVVTNIGILNLLEEFFSRAPKYDAIFLSCVNGHAGLYLKDFPVQKRRFDVKHPAPKLWYLGGNLSVQESKDAVAKRYRRMGFDFVSPKPITCDAIKEVLFKDFYNKISKNRE
ncbi:MAG: methylaspartate mutase [bacterium]|nr:methylaspartate mutase [bacterium]